MSIKALYFDWPLAKNDGISFAFAKATQNSFIDQKFVETWNTLKQLGIQRGAYDLFDPNADPKKQALIFAHQVSYLPGDLPPVLDGELIRQARDKTNEDVLASISIWVTEIERKTGRRPILYNGQVLLQENSRDRTGEYPVWLTRLPFWLAQYPLKPETQSVYQDPHAGPIELSPARPRGWPSDWSFWQFTDRRIRKGCRVRWASNSS